MTDEKWGPVLETVKELYNSSHRGNSKCDDVIRVINAFREATEPEPPPIEPGFYWARWAAVESKDMVVEVAIAAGCHLVYKPGREDAYDLSEWVIIAPVEPPNAVPSASMKPVYDAAMRYQRYDASGNCGPGRTMAYNSMLDACRKAREAEAS